MATLVWIALDEMRSMTFLDPGAFPGTYLQIDAEIVVDEWFALKSTVEIRTVWNVGDSTTRHYHLSLDDASLRHVVNVVMRKLSP